jgi:Tol biopolymer transport system component
VVVAHSVTAANPIWSPDGTRLSYTTGDGHAYVVPSDGSHASTDIGFYSGGWSPSWSPDGKHLAIAAGDGVLWIANVDGTDAHPITTGSYGQIGEKGWSADWSPDGRRLLFAAAKPDQDDGLYLVGLDGAPERLISPCANDGVWSPDGSLIAYLRCGIGVGPTLQVADSDGNLIRVFDGYYGWYMPAWSPDQTRIAILDDRPGDANEPGPPVIFLLDPLGQQPAITLPAGSTILTEDTAPDYTLTWQRLAP